jgi:hypothetical protein
MGGEDAAPGGGTGLTHAAVRNLTSHNPRHGEAFIRKALTGYLSDPPGGFTCDFA